MEKFSPEPGKWLQSDNPAASIYRRLWMKADYFKTVHMILSLEFPLEDVREFWQQVNHPDVGEVLPEFGFYRMGNIGDTLKFHLYRTRIQLRLLN